MKTHNAPIYHCIACGRVEHTEAAAEAPKCCGSTMAKAATDTVRDDGVTQATGSRPETMPQAAKSSSKRL
jgi:hypothetical protein